MNHFYEDLKNWQVHYEVIGRLYVGFRFISGVLHRLRKTSQFLDVSNEI